jgi:hypothetical protein
MVSIFGVSGSGLIDLYSESSEKPGVADKVEGANLGEGRLELVSVVSIGGINGRA